MNSVLMAYTVFIGVSLVVDVRSRKIPNALLAAGAAAALTLHATAGLGGDEALGWKGAALGCLSGLLISMPLYVLNAVSAGDVKWFGVAGAFAGPAEALLTVVLSVLLAGGCALLAIAISARLRRRWAESLAGIYIRAGYQRFRLPEGSATTIPFLICAAPAAIVAAMWL